MIGEFFARFNPELFIKYTEIVGKGNIKADLEEYIRVRVAAESVEGIDIKIIRKEILNLQESKRKIDSELQTKLNIEKQYQAKQKAKENLILQQEKEKILKSKTCINCKNLFSKQEKKHEFNQGLVCSNCFHNATPEMVKLWMIPLEVKDE